MTQQERRDWAGEQARDEQRFWDAQTCQNCDTRGEWDETDGTHTCRNCGETFEEAQ